MRATRVDSAGVTIVTASPSDTSIPTWHVQLDAPRLVLGGRSDSSGIFNFVGGLLVLPDGRLIASVEDDLRLRLLDSLGKPVKAFGRKGEGPGEFRHSPDIFLSADSLVAVDHVRGIANVTVWNAAFDLVRQFQVNERGDYDSWHGPLGVIDGRVLFMKAKTANHEVGPHRAKVMIDVGGPEGGDAVRVVDLLGDERVGLDGYRDTYVAFGKKTSAAVAGTVLATITNDGYEIAFRNAEGKLLRLVRLPDVPQPVTKSRREQYVRESIEDAPEDNRRLTETVMADVRFAQVLRPYDMLYPAQDGGFWVSEARFSERDSVHYLVLAPDGRLRARLTLPAGLRPGWIGADRVVLYGHDDEGVRYVGMYPIIKP